MCSLYSPLGRYEEILSLWIISSDINPVDSEYQEIHPYSALNIDNVKINTSLLMMRECRFSSSLGGSMLTVVTSLSLRLPFTLVVVAAHWSGER